MANKKNMAGKMTSKTYTNTRCGHCGKFGHHHVTHKNPNADIGNAFLKSKFAKGIPKSSKEVYREVWNRPR